MKTIKSATLDKHRANCRKKFLYYFPYGFTDPKYKSWERNYKWEAHRSFKTQLSRNTFKKLLDKGAYEDIAAIAVRIESKTNLLFSFEKMALRDAVKTTAGARVFAEGLFAYLYGKKPLKDRFENYVSTLAELPRKQTRVLTWPLLTVFGFIGDPGTHIFLKPRVSQLAAAKYGFDFAYSSKPNWNTYQDLLSFAEQIRKDNRDLQPVDFIDLQSFIWVMGSEEYPD